MVVEDVVDSGSNVAAAADRCVEEFPVAVLEARRSAPRAAAEIRLEERRLVLTDSWSGETVSPFGLV